MQVYNARALQDAGAETALADVRASPDANEQLCPPHLMQQDTLGRCMRRGQLAGMRLLMHEGLFTEAEVAAEEASFNAEAGLWKPSAVAGGCWTRTLGSLSTAVARAPSPAFVEQTCAVGLVVLN